ncbi:MAG: hypothetical protein M3N18_06935 [Actinomycetota bacterium]|nr:hypothetical protein [Actinomycetota bacterium]
MRANGAGEAGGGGGGELVRVCPAITRAGHRCAHPVNGGQEFCHHHSPDLAEERQLYAARGGRARHNPTGSLTRELHQQLSQLGEDVASGKLQPYRAAVVVQALNARIRLAEFELRRLEAADLETRLEQLERGRRGGAW